MNLNLIFYWGLLKMKIIETGLISSYYGKPLGRYEFDLKNNCDIEVNLYLVSRSNGVKLSSDLVGENIKIFDEKLNEDIGKFVGPICLNSTALIPCRMIQTTIIAEDCDYMFSYGRAWDLILKISVILRHVYHKNTHHRKDN